MVEKQHNYSLKNLENKIGDKNVSTIIHEPNRC